MSSPEKRCYVIARPPAVVFKPGGEAHSWRLGRVPHPAPIWYGPWSTGCSSVVEPELWGFSVVGSIPTTPTTLRPGAWVLLQAYGSGFLPHWPLACLARFRAWRFSFIVLKRYLKKPGG